MECVIYKDSNKQKYGFSGLYSKESLVSFLESNNNQHNNKGLVLVLNQLDNNGRIEVFIHDLNNELNVAMYHYQKTSKDIEALISNFRSIITELLSFCEDSDKYMKNYIVSNYYFEGFNKVSLK